MFEIVPLAPEVVRMADPLSIGAALMASKFGPQIASGLLGAVKNIFKRKRETRYAQGQADWESRLKEGAFLARSPNFSERAAFKRRLLGNLASAFTDKTYGEPGQEITIREFDLEKLFKNIGAGKFGEDLRGTKLSSIQRPDFTPPEVKSQSGSFWEDVFGSTSDLIAGYTPEGEKKKPGAKSFLDQLGGGGLDLSLGGQGMYPEHLFRKVGNPFGG
jgi:hypothetical protein